MIAEISWQSDKSIKARLHYIKIKYIVMSDTSVLTFMTETSKKYAYV